jgi:hypothetical protein
MTEAEFPRMHRDVMDTPWRTAAYLTVALCI